MVANYFSDVAMDNDGGWSALESRALPSLTSSSFQRGSRTLPELYGASQNLWASSTTAPATATSLLAASGTGPMLNLQSNNILHSNNDHHPSSGITMMDASMQENNNTSASGSALPLEARIAAYEQSIIDRLLKQQSNDLHRHLEEATSNHMQRLWQRDRQLWLNGVLGTNTPYLGGAVLTQQQQSTSDGPLQPALSYGNNNNNTQMALLRSPQASNNNNFLASPLRGRGRAFMSLPSSSTLPSFSSSSLDPTIVQTHLKIMQTFDPNRSNLLDTIKDFHDAAKQVVASGSSTGGGTNSSTSNTAIPRAFAGYVVAWKLLEPLVALYKVSGSRSSNNKNAAQHARASLLHLCRQYRQALQQRTLTMTGAGDSDAAAAGMGLNFSHPLAQTCAQYVRRTIATPGEEFESNNNNINSYNADSSFNIWPILYHCLRCGDAAAAWNVVETVSSTSNNAPLHPSVAQLVRGFAQAQGTNSSCLWDLNLPFPRLSLAHRQGVQDMIDLIVHQQQQAAAAGNNTPSISSLYQQGVYALIAGLSDLPSMEGLTGLSTIEDYLTGCLWRAVIGEDSASQNEQLQHLAQTITNLGPQYFCGATGGGGDATGGWAYALPLLAVQEYQTALSFLAEAGGPAGLLQATHLAWVLSTAGVPLSNLSETASDEESGEQQPPKKPINDHNLTASLLLAYSNHLLDTTTMSASASNSSPAILAMEYLVRIPNKTRAAKEVASLIVKTSALEQLVGTISEEGTRQDPVNSAPRLTQFFTPVQIQSILGDAANQLFYGPPQQQASTTRTNKGLAAMCLMLAERYTDVLALLNQCIAPQPTAPLSLFTSTTASSAAAAADPDRDFWIGQTQQFHTLYLNRRTNVLDVLEKEGTSATAVIHTSRTLLDWNQFMTLLQQGKSEDVYGMICLPSHLLYSKYLADLVPVQAAASSLEVDLSQYQETYLSSSLDPLVRAAIPPLVVGIAQVLSIEHARIKQQQQQSIVGLASSSSRSNSSPDQQPLKLLRQQAKVLMTYAAMLKLGQEYIEPLSRLESLMV